MRPQDAQICVIEDNASNRDLFEDLLTSQIQVAAFHAYPSGTLFFRWIDALSDRPPDVILLDIQMPREDGFAILQQIRARPSISSTRVVAVTANVLSAHLDRIRAAGFDGCLAKPIRVAAFESQLQHILDGGLVWDVH